MKQKMKSLMSIIVLILMMISMFSVCVFPASAATGDEYDNLQAGALVVNAAWSDKHEGDSVTYSYRGKEITEPFEDEWHFASFAAAWDYAASKNRTNPVIMIVGEYTGEILIKGAVTIIGANAGIDPVKEADSRAAAWTVSERFTNDSVITGSVIVDNSAGDGNIVFDGVTFGTGGAYMDKYRSTGASDLTFKNVKFDEAGNAASSFYALQLASEGHNRSIYLENIYVTGQHVQGFVSPYFVKFVGKHIAYVENSQGILNKTAFSIGVTPYIEFTDSCFYNSNVPSGPIISVDNYCCGTNYNISGPTTDKAIATSDQRSSSLLSISNCSFYNASSAAGLIHYEFINKNSTVSFVDNYVWSDADALTSILNPEFLLDSVNVDQTSCMYIRNNVLIGAYMIPDVSTGNKDTYIDMSYNYFGANSGGCVERPVYVNEKKPRLIRSAFWINEEMTVSSDDPMWDIAVQDWDMYQVDAFNFEVVLTAFEETGVTEFLPKFLAGNGSKVQLYKKATDVGGRYTNLSEPISQLSMADLKDDPYEPTVIYAQITNSNCNYFAPVYRIVLDNVGSIDDAKLFSKAMPGYYMYQPTVAKNATSSVVPYRWQGKIYRMEVGKNLFADLNSLIKYAKSKGDEIPNVVIPAGVYTEEMIIPGSCNILGEKHGVDPNVVVAEVITKENVATSGWTLNPERSNDKYETIFKNACIRVPASANDYIITIDGIKMGEGCSYVDDEAKTVPVANVTIFRNIIADGAGGGNDRSGATNIYLFNFNKPSGSGEIDNAHVYLYDSRIVNNQKCHVFGPAIEKLIVDHIYFGDAKTDPVLGNRNFLMNFRSRGVHSPYFSITNNCFYNNEKSNTNSDGLTGTYILWTNDHSADLSIKKNIIYNFDNNYCWNGFGQMNGGFQIYHCGSTMKFIMTNNIMISSYLKGNDTFLAGNATSRWAGDSASYDCSDCLVVKGNHIVGRTQLPHTAGTGNGTMIDYSGNYFAKTLADAPMTPDKLEPASGRNFTMFPTEAYYRKYKVDYTYLDWDMTKRSDDINYGNAAYALNSGMYGTGSYSETLFDGKTQMVFHDLVTAECKKYEIPAAIAPNCDVKIEKRNENGSYSRVSSMAPSGMESIFRVTVISKVSTAAVKEKSFIVKLNRKLNHVAKLLSMSGAFSNEYAHVDEASKTVYFYSGNDTFDFAPDQAELSSGATCALYSDAACRSQVNGSINLSAANAVDCYLKVTSENQNVFAVYTVKLIKFDDANPIDLAALNGISNMTYVGNNTFEAPVSAWYPEMQFKLDLFGGATAMVYRGTKQLNASSGKYTVDEIQENETLRVVVTAADGITSRTYTVRFVYEANSECDLLAVAGGKKTASGFYLNLGFAQGTTFDATVSDGATYEVFSADMQKKFSNNFVYLTSGTGSTIYVKVTAENGVNYKIYPVDVVTQANVGDKPVFAVKAGGKTYPAYLTAYNEFTAYLPDGVNEIQIDSTNIKGSFIYTGPDRSIVVDPKAKIKLGQKITTFYYTEPAKAERTMEFEGEIVTIRDAEENGTLRIVSGRKAVAYADSAKIAAWARPTVNKLNEGGYGIIMGDGNNNFNGSAAISRYELATIAVRMMGLDVNLFSGQALQYEDDIADWALPYVRAATITGIMSGTYVEGKFYFNGTGKATREQVASVLTKVVLLSEERIQPNSTITGIYTGAGAYFAAYKNELSVKYDSANFKDAAKVSAWAVPSMKMAVEFGLIKGASKSDGLYLNPKATITRAEVAVMVAGYLLK